VILTAANAAIIDTTMMVKLRSSLVMLPYYRDVRLRVWKPARKAVSIDYMVKTLRVLVRSDLIP
jgi:hypothetical protein